jgi:hypothetical protein
MKEPDFGGGEVHLDEEGVDTSSTAFNAAREACEPITLETHGIDIGG